MNHNRVRLFGLLFIIAGFLFIVSSLGKAEAQSGLPPLDSNCSDGECVFGVLTSTDDAGPTSDYDFSTVWHEIYFGRRANGDAIISGFRFANVTLPPNTGIAQAFLVFMVDGTYTVPVTVTLYGENSANAQPFSTSSQPASRLHLSGVSTVWPIPSSDVWIQNNVRQSPNVTAIVQAIVDKSGWQSGNALAILTETANTGLAPGSHRRVFAFDRFGNDTSTARLVIHTGPRLSYLPLVQKDFQFMKAKSGVHLGSGVSGNWSSLMQGRLTGGNPVYGIYPGVLVVLSTDLFAYTRGGPACRISAVSGVINPNLYNYITDAATKGTKVIIRIYPSPGNFQNALGASGTSHILLTGSGQRPPKPGGGTGDWCTAGNDTLFRSIDDIAQEMIAIRDYTNNNSGWKPYAFEPANEPNAEWLTPGERTISQPWVDMDTYFKNLYLEVHPGGANADIRVLAVPMAQSANAESKNVIDCEPFNVEGREGGLSWMEYTWMETVNGSPVNYNDGWSWHNYWRYGEEASNSNNACTPNSGHNFQAFPDTLKTTILNSPDAVFITEADLYSNCLGDPSPLLPDKGGLTIDTNGANAANAAKVFIREERGADYIAVWNITNLYSDTLTCQGPGNSEQAWHEAFQGNTSTTTTERYWFNAWWLDPTQP